MLNMIILPRQAREKHQRKKALRKKAFFRRAELDLAGRDQAAGKPKNAF